MIQVRNIDCLVGLREVPSRSVDMVLSDLPFETTNCHWDEKIPLKPLWTQINRVMKERAACVLFAQMPFAAELVATSPIKFRYEWIWEKPLGTGFFNAKKCPLRCHENILVFYRALPKYNPQWRQGEPYTKRRQKHWRGVGVYRTETARTDGENDGEHYYPRDVITFDSVLTSAEKRYHSTQKPIALLEYLIRTYTDAGDKVLDVAMGSGSTGVACINTDRTFIGFELDAAIFEIAKARLETAQVEREQRLF